MTQGKPFLTSLNNSVVFRNQIINSALDFCKKELDSWLKKMEGKTKERVVHCHNNLTIDHYVKNNTEAFISWDNYTVDTPVLDLYNLYQKDYLKYDFSNFLETYNNKFILTDEEKKLLFILISMPFKIELKENEFNNTKKVNNLLTYIYKTENLIRPYYSPKNPKQEHNLEN